MASTFDFGDSSLLCSEEDTGLFCDEFYCDELESFPGKGSVFKSNRKRSFSGDGELLLSDLPIQSDECLGLMINKETEHLPASDYMERLRNGDLDFGVREEAIDWITKVHAHFNFGPLCAYLSINYLDRFLSAYEIPKGKNWMIHLLAIACLSLAAKVEETEVPLSLDLQVGESRYVFEAKTIQRMELLVLSTLKWRMQAITPFSFLDYFLEKVNGGQVSSRTSILNATQLILITIKGIEFLEFKPSEIAAAVAISVLGETQIVDNEKAISFLTQLVLKEKLLKCVEIINGKSLLKGRNGSSVPQSPIGVLDAACLNYSSDNSNDTTIAVGSCAKSSHDFTSQITKRRKLNLPFEVDFLR